MIEALMYMGIGLLAGCLVGLAVIPLVHDRAVRLTIRRLEGTLPNSIKEIQADKDLLRADFAMSTRRLELSIEQLRNKTTSQFAELGRKADIINRLKTQRDVLKVEVLGLTAQMAALSIAVGGGGGASVCNPTLAGSGVIRSRITDAGSQSVGLGQGPQLSRSRSLV